MVKNYHTLTNIRHIKETACSNTIVKARTKTNIPISNKAIKPTKTGNTGSNEDLCLEDPLKEQGMS